MLQCTSHASHAVFHEHGWRPHIGPGRHLCPASREERHHGDVSVLTRKRCEAVSSCASVFVSMGVSAEDRTTCEKVLNALMSDEALFLSDGFRAARVLMSQLVDRLRQRKKYESHEMKRNTEPRTSHHSYHIPAGYSEGKPLASFSVCEVKPAQFSRLLYANPVCLLSSCHGDEPNIRNIMTVSWLTAVDNNGHLIVSINKRRHSAVNILSSGTFVLNVPTAQLAQTALEIGSCSGGITDKIERFGTLLGGYCLPGWKPLETWPPRDEDGEAEQAMFAIGGCVAHLVVQVLLDLPDIPQLSSHHLLVCHVRRAFVRSTYWDGKVFAPQLDVESQTPPYMSFFGSQTFGYIVPGCLRKGG